jgi:hypothetical protein
MWIERKRVISDIKKCCPKKTPDSLGASPTRCEKCESLMKLFKIQEKEIEEQDDYDIEIKICPHCSGSGKIYKIVMK